MATKPVITKLSDDIDYWNVLLFADSGTGKTVFAGSDVKVLFIAPEDKGLISSKRVNKNADNNKILVKQWEDLKNTIEWYEDHPEELKEFNVFSVDSITEMQNLAKDYVLRMTYDEKLRKNQDPELMQLQDYGTMHTLVEALVRSFNDLPINVLYTATAKKVKDADENEFLVPDLQGKGDYGIAMKIVALMTSYGYMRVEIHDVPAPTEDDPKAIKEVKRRVIYWEDTGTIRGKDRTTALTPYTVNMNLQQMRLTIAGKMHRDSDGWIKKNDNGSVAAKEPAKAAPKKPVPQASPEATNPVESKPEPTKEAAQDTELEVVKA